MVSHYIDIHLRPDPEFAAHQLMAALYSKLHRELAQGKFTEIGVGFPQYSEAPATLGSHLRLLGSALALQRLMASPWLNSLHDHIQVSALASVPTTSHHMRLNRVQAKSSPERLRRRQMKRHGLTEDEARARIPDNCAESLSLPYVVLRSASTAQTFRIFLRCELTDTAASGSFSTYGLSNTATIPCF